MTGFPDAKDHDPVRHGYNAEYVSEGHKFFTRSVFSASRKQVREGHALATGPGPDDVCGRQTNFTDGPDDAPVPGDA